MSIETILEQISAEATAIKYETDLPAVRQDLENKVFKKITASGGVGDKSTISGEESTSTAYVQQNKGLLSVLAKYVAGEESASTYHARIARARSSESNLENHTVANFAKGFNGVVSNSASVALSNAFSPEGFVGKDVGEIKKRFIQYNISTAQQDSVNREFWRLRMVEPGNVGVSYNIPVLTTRRESRMPADSSFNFHDTQRNVWDAVRDSSILEGDYLTLYPVFVSGSNDADFAAYGSEDVEVMGVSVTTRPLKARKNNNAAKVNLLNLSRSNIPGVTAAMTGIDTIAPGTFLDTIYFDTTVGADPYTVGVKVKGLKRTQFTLGQQGSNTETVLSMENVCVRMQLGKIENLADNGAPVAAFSTALVEDDFLELSIDMAGSLNLENGMCTAPSAGSVSVKAIHHTAANGDMVVYDSGNMGTAPQDVQDAFTLATSIFSAGTYDSFKVAAKSTNHAQRESGLLVDSRGYRIAAVVTPRTPFTILSEASGNANVETVTVETISELVKQRRNNDGVLKLIEMSELYHRAYGNATSTVSGVREGPAIATNMVLPYYVKDDIDVAANYMNVQSANRDADITGGLVSYLKAHFTKAVRDSHYAGTLRNKYPGSKPQVILATDFVTASYLTKHGDPRLFGDTMDVEITVSDLKEMDGRIIGSFARKEGREDGDFLSFGETIQAPDYIVDLSPTSSGGNTSERRYSVRPAYEFIPILPIMLDISVDNLVLAAQTKSVLPTDPQGQ